MAKWENFTIWRGRLPHWRAENVTYYATFKHRRALSGPEAETLLSELRKPDDKKLEIDIICVLPEQTELIFRVKFGPNDEPYELSDVLEKAKNRANKQITKRSGEERPVFYRESYDRILRDEAEYEEFWTNILESPIKSELCEEPDEYSGLYVRDAG
jgi:hypothetical protein